MTQILLLSENLISTTKLNVDCDLEVNLADITHHCDGSEVCFTVENGVYPYTILIDGEQPEKRWQGSNAAEEIARLLPLGDVFIAAYRAIPGMKWIGDRSYEQVRDNRYNWFGKTNETYYSDYPFGCGGK